MADHPEFLIASPPMRARHVFERWIVAMHRGEPGRPWRVVFRHSITGEGGQSVTCEWADGQWLAPPPSWAPETLASKAHRILRHRAGRPGAVQSAEASPADRLQITRSHLAAIAATKADRARRLVGA